MRNKEAARQRFVEPSPDNWLAKKMEESAKTHSSQMPNDEIVYQKRNSAEIGEDEMAEEKRNSAEIPQIIPSCGKTEQCRKSAA